MKTLSTTQSQHQSIANYRRMGLDIEVIDNDTVKITQSRLLNGHILNNRQLYERANEIFPEKHILPVVYSLQVDDIDLNWIELKMDEFGIKRKDLIKQLAIDKSSLSLIFSGNRELSKPMRATFFYYFLTYELNRDLREQLNGEGAVKNRRKPKFDLGDKVVPKYKPQDSEYIEKVRNSTFWKEALNTGKPFLYVTRVVDFDTKIFYMVSLKERSSIGDAFYEDELVSFQE